MYFYHEHYHDAYAQTLEDLPLRDRRDDSRAYETIEIPAILNWLVTVGVALCVIVGAIQFLS